MTVRKGKKLEVGSRTVVRLEKELEAVRKKLEDLSWLVPKFGSTFNVEPRTAGDDASSFGGVVQHPRSFKILTEHAHLVTSLSHVFRPTEWTEQDTLFFRLLAKATNLTHLELRGFAVGREWEQSAEYEQVLASLQNLPHLESFRAGLLFDDRLADIPFPPSLKHLALHTNFLTHPGLSHLLTRIGPTLETLELRFTPKYDQFDPYPGSWDELHPLPGQPPYPLPNLKHFDHSYEGPLPTFPFLRLAPIETFQLRFVSPHQGRECLRFIRQHQQTLKKVTIFVGRKGRMGVPWRVAEMLEKACEKRGIEVEFVEEGD
ncbi:hypothetical protein JCM10213_002227 [Rhodosporidiobolus nylandii]